MRKDLHRNLIKLGFSSLSLSALLSIGLTVWASDGVRHYYQCQSGQGKTYSDKPCPSNQQSQRVELPALADDSERQRLAKQLEQERKLTAQWQTRREQDDARHARLTQQLARKQQKTQQRCQQAQLKLQGAEQDLKDVQPKNEMAMRKKYQLQQQKTDLICKSA